MHIVIEFLEHEYSLNLVKRKKCRMYQLAKLDIQSLCTIKAINLADKTIRNYLRDKIQPSLNEFTYHFHALKKLSLDRQAA